ncbi:lipocalin [Caulobacter sp. SLTY]|uniref:lipocalin family protein n=1 Tax=Caulobacter sp. SLTY TaxID=2683262 RepID=UPI001411C9B6|nr:lipocalin family protein [Caulobacter sp. SLTY]NBB14103.1 lipocalin [Caulobacter sp. SLTY]
MKTAIVISGALLLAALPAVAAAPQPTKPISASFYSGTWYEVARTPNGNQKDCHAPTSQFSSAKGGKYLMTQTCRRGSPAGPTKVWKAEGQIVPGSGNAKFKARFFGLVNQEYWILDTAGDGSWGIMATPGGNYVWLMSRKAVMTPAAKAAAIGRIKALGYNTAKLEQPKQPPA